MFQFFKGLFGADADVKKAIELARMQFQKQTGKNDYKSWAKVIAKLESGHVVRLCYGYTKPPKRIYFHVSSDGTVREMEASKVRQFGERSWR